MGWLLVQNVRVTIRPYEEVLIRYGEFSLKQVYLSGFIWRLTKKLQLKVIIANDRFYKGYPTSGLVFG